MSTIVNYLFHPLCRPRTYFYVDLIDGAARIFPMYLLCRNRESNSGQFGSVAPLLRDLYPGCLTD